MHFAQTVGGGRQLLMLQPWITQHDPNVYSGAYQLLQDLATSVSLRLCVQWAKKKKINMEALHDSCWMLCFVRSGLRFH